MDSFAPRLYRRTFLSPLVLRATVASGLFSPLICLCSVNRQALLHMKPMAPANRWTKRTFLESPSCRSFRLLLPFSFSQRFIPVLSCLFFLWRLFSLSSLFLFPCSPPPSLHPSISVPLPSSLVYLCILPDYPPHTNDPLYGQHHQTPSITIETLRPGLDLAGQRPNPATDVLWQT